MHHERSKIMSQGEVKHPQTDRRLKENGGSNNRGGNQRKQGGRGKKSSSSRS
jgi:hypothetical protein